MSDAIRRLVTQETIDRYGAINGDNDIIHYDADYAARRGFRGTLAHGLMVMGYAAELGVRRYGADWFTGGKLQVVWTAPVCPGDEVLVTAENSDVEVSVGGETVLAGTMSADGSSRHP